MYDERTRQLDHQWATYAYAREEGIEYGMAQGMERGMQQGIERGMEQGIERGRAEGMEEAVITLMKKGHISPDVAATQLNVNVEELNKYL